MSCTLTQLPIATNKDYFMLYRRSVKGLGWYEINMNLFFVSITVASNTKYSQTNGDIYRNWKRNWYLGRNENIQIKALISLQIWFDFCDLILLSRTMTLYPLLSLPYSSFTSNHTKYVSCFKGNIPVKHGLKVMIVSHYCIHHTADVW